MNNNPTSTIPDLLVAEECRRLLDGLDILFGYLAANRVSHPQITEAVHYE